MGQGNVLGGCVGVWECLGGVQGTELRLSED